ncbi:hypothetical protein, partial [Klebsiella pneumoniae]
AGSFTRALCGYSILEERLRIAMKYQENDSFVIFPSRPEQSPLHKVAAMDKSSKLMPPCAQYSYLPSA